VQKDDELKKFRTENIHLKQFVKEFEDKENLIKKNVEDIELELTEIRKEYEVTHTKNLLL
jgi:hypothetical protein